MNKPPAVYASTRAAWEGLAKSGALGITIPAIYARTRAAYTGLGPKGSPGRTRERTPPPRAEQPLFPARARNINCLPL